MPDLPPDVVKRIDEALFANAGSSFRKVAYIVGAVMSLPDAPEGVQDIYYAERVKRLVEAGRLEARGNPLKMRFSEVRLADRPIMPAPSD